MNSEEQLNLIKRKLQDVRNLAKEIGNYDYSHGDQLYLKFGGDGDNGEALIEALEHVVNQVILNDEY